MGGDQVLIGPGAQAVTRTRVLAVAHIHHHHGPTVFVAQQLQRTGHHRCKLTVGQQHLGFAVVQLPGQQSRIQAGVQGVENSTQGRHRIVRLHHLRRVGQHGADRVAMAHTQGLQRGRQPRRTVAHLGPVVAAMAMHNRRQVGKHFRRPLDKADRRQGHLVGGTRVQALFVDAHLHSISAQARARPSTPAAGRVRHTPTSGTPKSPPDAPTPHGWMPRRRRRTHPGSGGCRRRPGPPSGPGG